MATALLLIAPLVGMPTTAVEDPDPTTEAQYPDTSAPLDALRPVDPDHHSPSFPGIEEEDHPVTHEIASGPLPATQQPGTAGTSASAQPADVCDGRAEHEPIHITGNSGFEESGSGVVAGDGSAQNPYVIEGWCINDGGLVTGAAIFLDETTAHVVIRDNGISPESFADGIRLRTSTNVDLRDNDLTGELAKAFRLVDSDQNTIAGNTVTSAWEGAIHLTSSSGNTIEGNTIADSRIGISLSYSSDGNIVASNSIRDITWGGVWVRESAGNTLEGNRIAEVAYWGVYHPDSVDTTFAGNEFDRAGLILQGSKLAHFVHTFDDTNTVNGDPLVYIRGQTGVEVPENVGQVIIVDSTNILADGLNITRGDVGVTAAFSENVTVRNSTFTGNASDTNLCCNVARSILHGVFLVRTNNSTVEENTFTHVGRHGVWLQASGYNTIRDNVMFNTSWGGHASVELEMASSHNMIENNTSTRGESYGIRVYGSNGPSTHNVVRSNTISHRWYNTGIRVDGGAVHNKVLDNSASGMQYGIRVGPGADHAIVRENTATENNRSGIVLSSVQDTLVERNTASSNGGQGFVDLRGMGNEFIANNATGNNDSGISILRSYGGTAQGNNIEGNTFGMYIAHELDDDPAKIPITVDVRENWWGSLLGPSGLAVDACTGVPAAGTGQLLLVQLSMVCFFPWLTEPNPDAGAG